MNTVTLLFGLQHPENEHNRCFLVLETQRLDPYAYTIQGDCFIIRTMNKTNSALNTSNIKLIFTNIIILELS